MSSYVNTSYFTARSDDKPACRRIGNQVYWKGEVYCTTAVGAKQADILLGFPTWCCNQGDPQYSNCGVLWDSTLPYNIFVVYSNSLNRNRIRVQLGSNITTQTYSQGFQLTNLWRIFCKLSIS